MKISLVNIANNSQEIFYKLRWNGCICCPTCGSVHIYNPEAGQLHICADCHSHFSDTYSYAHDNPYRIDFFGDEVDSIREFDIETQLSKSRVERCRLVEDKDRQGKPTGKRYMVVQQVKTIGGALHLLNKVFEG